MRSHLIGVAVVASLCWTLPAEAIVNVEDIHLGRPDPGFSGHLELGANGASGNTETKNYLASTRLQHYRQGLTRFLTMSYTYGESFEVASEEKSFMHARLIKELSRHWAFDLFAQAESDRFARLNLRALAGGGMRLDAMPDNQRVNLLFGAGVFYSHEDIDDESGATDAGESNFWRGNFYLVYKHKLAEHVNLSYTAYVQPRVDEVKDFRVLEQAGLVMKLNERLSLKIGINVAHDNRPPAGVTKTDTSYTSSLRYDF